MDRAKRRAAILKEIGNRIRIERERKGMTKSALAKHCGLDLSAIGRIEAGEQALDFDPLMRAAEALGATIDYLVAGKGDPPPGERAPESDQDQRRRAARG